MQSDKSLDGSFLSTKAWEREPVTGRSSVEVKRFELPSLERGKLSFSGNERNHLFQNQGGTEFQDVSSISGLDAPQDSRAFAVWDFDRDGWQDIAMLNINTPVLSIYRNQLGASGDDAQPKRKMIALQFVGGNTTDQPSEQYGCRDGFGVKVTATLSERTFIRELRCGEGLAAQNTKTMLFGIAEHDQVNSIAVQWPSGISQRLENIQANELVKIFENAADSSDGTGFERSQYIVESHRFQDTIANGLQSKRFSLVVKPAAKLVLYTSMATWCPNCSQQIPQLHRLREHFSKGDLEMFGVPMDESETDEQLLRYFEKNRPPYMLDGRWNLQPRADFKRLILEHFQMDVLPATMITSQQGQVLAILPGVPTVSETARLLHTLLSQETGTSGD